MDGNGNGVWVALSRGVASILTFDTIWMARSGINKPPPLKMPTTTSLPPGAALTGGLLICHLFSTSRQISFLINAQRTWKKKYDSNFANLMKVSTLTSLKLFSFSLGHNSSNIIQIKVIIIIITITRLTSYWLLHQRHIFISWELELCHLIDWKNHSIWPTAFLCYSDEGNCAFRLG